MLNAYELVNAEELEIPMQPNVDMGIEGGMLDDVKLYQSATGLLGLKVENERACLVTRFSLMERLCAWKQKYKV